jgi:hypothetical protein
MKACECINLIKQLQANHKGLILCGSAALILAGILPDRNIGDIDFATTDKSLIGSLHLARDAYADEVLNGGYLSYSSTRYREGFGVVKLNLLVFNPDININTESLQVSGGTITYQHIPDILRWKEKYNRKKDLIDLDSISLNMLEKAVFDK